MISYLHLNYISILHHFLDINAYFPKIQESRDPDNAHEGKDGYSMTTSLIRPICTLLMTVASVNREIGYDYGPQNLNGSRDATTPF